MRYALAAPQSTLLACVLWKGNAEHSVRKTWTRGTGMTKIQQHMSGDKLARKTIGSACNQRPMPPTAPRPRPGLAGAQRGSAARDPHRQAGRGVRSVFLRHSSDEPSLIDVEQTSIHKLALGSAPAQRSLAGQLQKNYSTAIPAPRHPSVCSTNAMMDRFRVGSQASSIFCGAVLSLHKNIWTEKSKRHDGHPE